MEILCKVNEMMESIKQKIENSIKESGKRIRVMLDSKGVIQDLEIQINADVLRQAIDILAENSLKHSLKGIIKLGYEILETGEIRFFVEDTGEGIDVETLHRLRKELSNHAISDGIITHDLTGAHKLIQTLGGKIHLDSDCEQGTRVSFDVLLQAKDLDTKILHQNAQKDDTVPDSDDDKSWVGKTFLIAEDEDINYMFLEVLFEETGVILLRANDGVEALELVKTHDEIDIILMDIKMPRMNGLEATQEIRTFKPHIPIIVQTAFAMQEDKFRAIQAGASDYITKPIDSVKLFALIDKYLWQKNE